MSLSTKHLYEFGSFRLDTRERLLLCKGERVKLERKVFETLIVLVQHGGHLVHKDEFMNQVWPDAVVEENNLEKSISVLRKVLGENDADAQYIETVRGLGYRFAADVRELDEEVSTLVRHESRTSVTVEDEEIDLIPPVDTDFELVQVKASEALAQNAIPRRSFLSLRTAAVLALVVATTVASYFFLVRRHHASGLTDLDKVLIADFDNLTGDTVFDGTLKQGLAVQLQQSPFLNLFADARARQTLKLMNRSPDERVTEAIGREICQRQGIKALIAGAIAPLGSHYVITLEAITAQTGEVIAREQVEAESKEQVLKALTRAASELREKLGESLASIQKFDAPLEVTTSSLDALKAYSLGFEQSLKGKYPEAIAFHKRAIELDPNFASAYQAAAAQYNNIRQGGLAADYATRAYALRDRVSEREKLRIAYWYYTVVTGELDKAIEALELSAQTYPSDDSASTSLAGRYQQISQFDRAEAAGRQGIRLDPTKVFAYVNLAQVLMRLNRFAEAREVIDQAVKQQLDVGNFHTFLFEMAFADGDAAAMQRQIDLMVGRPDEYRAFDWQSGAAAFVGQWGRSQDLTRKAVDLAVQEDRKGAAAEIAAEQSLRAAAFGRCAETGPWAAQSLALERDRSALPLATLALALCGQRSEAKGQTSILIDELMKRYPKDTLVNNLWLPMVSAALELPHGSSAKAIESLEAARRHEGDADFRSQYVRGLAYLKVGRGVEAEAEFQNILDHRGLQPLSTLYALAHVGLARAAALDGDATKARKFYEEFFTLWKDADSDLPILIEARKEYSDLK